MKDTNINKLLRTHLADLLRECVVSQEVLWLFDTGGKRLRPRFVFAALQDLLKNPATQVGVPAEISQAGVEVAAAVELLHIASLVHDDLPCLDDASERRGNPAAHKIFGEAQALLIGDLLPMLAVKSISGASWMGHQVKLGILDILALTYQKLCEGQIQELQGNATLEDFIKVAENKTGALFAFALGAAAVIANSDLKTISKFRDLGIHIGVYFQGLDDLADGDAIIHADAMRALSLKITEGLLEAEKFAGGTLNNLRAVVKEALDL